MSKECQNNIEVFRALVESENSDFSNFIEKVAFCSKCWNNLKLLNPFGGDENTWELKFSGCKSRDCEICYMGYETKTFDFAFTGIYVK